MYCTTVFHVVLLNVAMFLFSILLLFHSSHVAIFSWCTLPMLHYFQRCCQDPHNHLWWRASQRQLTKLLNIVAKLSIFGVRGVLVTRLLFPCCNFFTLNFFNIKNIENEPNTENTTKKWRYTQHHEFVSLYFDILTHFCHYIVLNDW